MGQADSVGKAQTVGLAQKMVVGWGLAQTCGGRSQEDGSGMGLAQTCVSQLMLGRAQMVGLAQKMAVGWASQLRTQEQSLYFAELAN